MPELPEVETLRRDLEFEVRGQSIIRAQVHQVRMTHGQPVAYIEEGLRGQQITAIERRGKFLLVRLRSSDRLLLHRGMSGNLLLQEQSELIRPHRHLSLELNDGRFLSVYDPRGFGEIRLLTAEQAAAHSARLGPEPLGPDFTAEYLAARWARRSAPTKALLLHQGMVAGLGNIYADECLWTAKLHPARPAGELKPEELRVLQASVQAVLAEAIEFRGTTFSDALDLHGKPGAYQEELKIFHRAACPRCGSPVHQTRVAGRGTSLCPACQAAPVPSDPRQGRRVAPKVNGAPRSSVAPRPLSAGAPH